VSASAPLLGETSEEQLLTQLRSGDETAFCALVRQHHAFLVRLAGTMVPRGEAEEVAQEAWLAVVAGLPGFAGRSALKTWIVGILLHKARSRAERTHRDLPMSSLLDDDPDSDAGPAVDSARFRGTGDPFAGYWCSAPVAWWASPESRVDEQETRRIVWDALRMLPARQRQVVVLRDLEGFTAEDVCSAMNMSAGNQRVLLHRGRSQLRAVLEARLGGLS
jgi:RNA polymerase sigma-70 factor (ECF subfamily)